MSDANSNPNKPTVSPSDQSNQGASADATENMNPTEGSPTPEPNQDGPDLFAAFGQQVEQLQAKVSDLQERLLLSQAELENYRKRAQKELDQERQFRSLPLCRDVLPAFDNLQRTLQSAKGTKDVDLLLKGVQMVVQQFEEGLARHAIVPIPSVGQPFDPNLHEAIQQAPSPEHPPMTVLHEVERGYKMHERVVRPTKVIVSVKPTE